jgi:hypothetical protein
MRGYIINDQILAWGNIDGQDTYEIPDDYSPERYNYIPAVAGVFDPNGFVLRVNTTIDFDRRQSNVNQMNSYMDSLRLEGAITQGNFDLFLADTAINVQVYLGGGTRLNTWIDTTFKTKTAYRGPLVNGLHPRAEMILSILNNL